MWWVFNVASVIIFCISARQLLKAATEQMNWDRLQDYSARALRAERAYRIFAWGAMTFIWIYLCWISFLTEFNF